ncbi:VG15 protein [Corynebacterium variabile]|uniref:VG15 protein n=1 Tax=Corynebacterium variabile TaxID=1727 RepID=UPI003FD426F4
MARTHAGEKLTEEHRLEQVKLAANLSRAITKLFSKLFAWDDIVSSSTRFGREAAKETARYREASRMLSVDYMAAFRQVEAPDSPPIIEEPDDIEVSDLATTIIGTTRGVALSLAKKGYREDESRDRILQAVTGKTTKLAEDGGRKVLENEVKRGGSGPVGYARVVDADPCSFCAMLASRGVYMNGAEAAGVGLYRSDSFADSAARFIGDGRFMVHDSCCCTLEPVYKIDGAITLPGNGNKLAEEWAQIAAGQDDPWLTWQRWRESGTLPENYDGPLEGTRRAAPAHGQSTGRRARPDVAKDSERRGRSELAGSWDADRYRKYASELETRAVGVQGEIAALKAVGKNNDDLAVMALAQELKALTNRAERYRREAERLD